MNILATVGTAEWDDMIQALDEQVGAGFIDLKVDKIVAQIGRGLYEPKNFRFYRIADEETHQRGIDWADLIISTGGAGTLQDCLLNRKKKMIFVWMRPWSPQAFKPWVDGDHVLYCKDLEDLHLYIQKAKTWMPVPFEPERLDLKKVLEELMEQETRMSPFARISYAFFSLLALVVFLLKVILG